MDLYLEAAITVRLCVGQLDSKESWQGVGIGEESGGGLSFLLSCLTPNTSNSGERANWTAMYSNVETWTEVYKLSCL